MGVDSYDAYSPSLDSGSYPGWNQVNDDNNATDFIWHLRDRNGNFSPSGKNQTAETLEHALHTLSQFALPAAFPEELNIFSENGQADGISSDLADAYQEAVRNGVYDPSDYSDANDGSDSYAQLLLREYVYCLIFAEWGFTQALIEGGSLAPEWSDAHLSPTAIARDNPIGHRLFTNYISKIISKPSLQDLSLMFQDGDQGRSGYLPSSGEAIPEAPQPDAPLAPAPNIPSPQETPTTVSQPIPEPAPIPSPAVDPQPITTTEAPPPPASATPTPAPAPDTTTSTTTTPSIAGPITTLLSAPLSEAKGHLKNLKPKQFSTLKPDQLSAFRPVLFQAISASQIKALSTSTLNAIAPAQLDKLKPNAFKG